MTTKKSPRKRITQPQQKTLHNQSKKEVTMSKKFTFILILAIFAVILAPKYWENLDANEIMVVQSPISGNLSVYTTPGWKTQAFGTVTKYPMRAEYVFNDEPSSKLLQFNDGGKGYLYAAVSWKMPLDHDKILSLHKAYNNPERVQQEAVARMIDSAIFLAGPLMSSTESAGERRAELLGYINDQALNGVYVTKTESKKTSDAMTGDETVARVATIVTEADGVTPKRQQASILREFGIELLPISITNLDYDTLVEAQIAKRQEAITNVQLAQAAAREAQQNTITVEEQGKASAAKAKWDQETIKAQVVTEAEQRRDVARLDAEAAALTKQQQILLGQGEAERKRLVMSADGALEKKLAALVEMNRDQWTAISNYKGSWVPTINMGESGKGGNQNAALDLVNLLTAQSAKSIAADLTIPKGE